MGDHNIPLSEWGILQARKAGETVGMQFINDSLIFCSPYKRAKETLAEILKMAEQHNVKPFRIREDPRLR